ncbi:MAG: glycosyltransferase family 2 protein [Bacteroidota bacterium]
MQEHTAPLVSIITPAYNSEKFIAETIDSVREQTYQNWEMLIVDDCSTDNTVAHIEKIAKVDSRVKLSINPVNSGAAVTRNKGLEMAKGRFIAFLDSDDKWYKNKLALQVEFMLSRNIPISFTSYGIINENGETLNKTVKSVASINYWEHFKNTIIGMSTSMIDTDVVGRDFTFVNMRTRQDCYLWITLLKRGHIAYGMENVLSDYRVREGSISSNKIKGAQKVWHLYYGMEKLGFIKSLYYFSFYVYNAIKKRM